MAGRFNALGLVMRGKRDDVVLIGGWLEGSMHTSWIIYTKLATRC
jgi:hypothetical protein